MVFTQCLMGCLFLVTGYHVRREPKYRKLNLLTSDLLKKVKNGVKGVYSLFISETLSLIGAACTCTRYSVVFKARLSYHR